MQKLSQDNSVSLVTRLQVGRYRNGSLTRSQGTRLPSKASRPAVGPIRLILAIGALSLGIHLLECENDHSLPPCANITLYGTDLHSPHAFTIMYLMNHESRTTYYVLK